jgi:hypothetical protein
MVHLGLVKACIVHISFYNGLHVLALHTGAHEMLLKVFPLEIPPTQHIQNYTVSPWFVN